MEVQKSLLLVGCGGSLQPLKNMTFASSKHLKGPKMSTRIFLEQMRVELAVENVAALRVAGVC